MVSDAWEDIETAEEFVKKHGCILSAVEDERTQELKGAIKHAAHVAQCYAALIIDGMAVRAMEAKLVTRRDAILRAQDGRMKTENIPDSMIHVLLKGELERATAKAEKS